MFNKKIGLILVLALAAGLGLLAAQKFFGPVTPATRWPATCPSSPSSRWV